VAVKNCLKACFGSCFVTKSSFQACGKGVEGEVVAVKQSIKPCFSSCFVTK
jgi:hypothetical protein